jgi:D-alanine--poly(phosphoribitol) ligase subunit 1
MTRRRMRAQDGSPACPLLHRLQTVVERHPDGPATVDQDGVVTYRELWDRVLTWRDRLLASALPSNAPVAVLTRGTSSLVPAFFGVRAAHLVPLLVDAFLPPGQRDDMVRLSRSVAVLDTGSDSLTRVDHPESGEASQDSHPAGLPPEAGYVAFSSGSQGPPKGIVGNAAGVDAFVEWEQELLGLGAEIRGALLTSPSFDVVLRDMLVPLLSGGVLCVPGPKVRTDPAAVVPWLARHQVNVVHLVPTLSTRWVSAAEPATLPALEWTLFAGEPLYDRHVHRWRAVAPTTRVVNLYGPSETTLARYWHVVDEPVPAGLQPVGRGLPGTLLELDAVDQDGASAGALRITLETPDGSLGYLPDGASVDDARALVRRHGVTRFVTQDRGRIGRDGLLFVEGRLDGLVKRNGVMVDLAHITATALGEPGVSQATCFQIDPDESGNIALVVEGTAALSVPRLTGQLRRTLGPAMPNQVVHVESLPELPNGKIDRRGLREAVRRGAGSP